MDVHKPMQYDFVKKQLQKYLDPNAAVEEAAPFSNAPTAPAAPVSTDFTLENATAGNKDTVSKFDDLLNE